MHGKKLALKIHRNQLLHYVNIAILKEWFKNARLSSRARNEWVFYQPRSLDLLHETEDPREVGDALCFIPAATNQAPAQ